MKTIIFAGTLHLAAAVKMHQNLNQFHALDFAQIANQKTNNSLAEGASYIATDATTITDAQCEELQNGIVVRLNTPECQLVKKPSSEAMLIGAVDQIGKQARDIQEALAVEFSKPAEMVVTKPSELTVNGIPVK